VFAGVVVSGGEWRTRFIAGGAYVRRMDVQASSLSRHGDRDLACVAFGVARAALDEQHVAVRDLRAHTGALLTATSVVVSFLGTRALSTPHLRVMSFVGLGAFVGSLMLCLYVLLPTAKIESLRQGGSLFGMDLDTADPATDAYERLVDTYDDLWAVNRPHVQRLGRVFRMACAAIVIEVVLWALQLALS
jgi:hypothetical protein